MTLSLDLFVARKPTMPNMPDGYIGLAPLSTDLKSYQFLYSLKDNGVISYESARLKFQRDSPYSLREGFLLLGYDIAGLEQN